MLLQNIETRPLLSAIVLATLLNDYSCDLKVQYVLEIFYKVDYFNDKTCKFIEIYHSNIKRNVRP